VDGVAQRLCSDNHKIGIHSATGCFNTKLFYGYFEKKFGVHVV
jgi:hypothetical protein